jgi:hypothetical protein
MPLKCAKESLILFLQVSKLMNAYGAILQEINSTKCSSWGERA